MNFQRLIKSLNIDYSSFNVWAEKATNQNKPSRNKRLFDAYDRSLRRIEIFESNLQTWMMRHEPDRDFEPALKAKVKRLRELERFSVARLRRIFDAYLQDMARQ